MASNFELSLASYEDMHRMVEVIYAANRAPYDPFVDLFCPGLSDASTTPLAEGIQDTAFRYLQEWKSTPTQRWLKVVDPGIGNIASVIKWEVFADDPYGEGKSKPETKADWLPENSLEREYAEYLVDTRYEIASKRCRCPHMFLDICATHPDYRRRGAASLGLEWGVEQADKMQVRAFIEATVDGASLYRRFGFETADILHIRRDDSDVKEDWRKLQEEIPLVFRWMVREPR